MASEAITIVQAARRTHKSRGAIGCLVVVVLTLSPAETWAQTDSLSPVPVGRVLSVAGSGVVFLAPHLLNVNEGPPECAPCDRDQLPWFDRWSVVPERGTSSVASTVILFGLAAGTWWDLSRRGEGQGFAAVAASIEATSWALGVTELGKAVFARKRPVLYTDDAVEIIGARGVRRSMPSGHTAAAFALATSYLLQMRGRDANLPAWLVTATAAGVGVLRVVAGRHFPSDAVAGAAVGVVSAVVVHEIRF